jgi:putrescine transport system ATP-binding protein
MIDVSDIAFAYDELVLNGITFQLPTGLTLSILGHSGCGKTTLLRILAGLEAAHHGSFHLENQDLFALSAKDRNVVYISQEPLLFPHLNVFENLAFGLRLRKIGEDEIQRLVREIALQTEIVEHLSKMPHQLSGGQKQRVSFGRAIIIRPRMLLLDEPFSSLDGHTREGMQVLFKKICHEYDITAIFVTHDLKEALKMADRIAVMRDGRLKWYPNIADFIKDPQSGVDKEKSFWTGLGL